VWFPQAQLELAEDDEAVIVGEHLAYYEVQEGTKRLNKGYVTHSGDPASAVATAVSLLSSLKPYIVTAPSVAMVLRKKPIVRRVKLGV